MKPVPLKQRFNGRVMVWLCVAALLLSLLPLYTLSFYNHASYGDLGQSLLTRSVWLESNSWLETIGAAAQNAADNSEGTYATAFLAALQPAVADGQLYWLTTLILLSFFLISLHFFLKQVLVRILGTDAYTYWTAFCCVAFVMIQFVPELSEAFFWYSGGVAYTLMWSFVVLRLGLWVRLSYAQTKASRLMLGAAVALLTLVVGGAKYSTLFFALIVEVMITAWAFYQKRNIRLFAAVMLVVMLVCGACGVLSPDHLGAAEQGVNALTAVTSSFALGFRLMGNWFSLPLLVVWALVAWQLSEALHGSPFRFSHPIWITVLAVFLFCVQIIPAVYSGEYLADGRTINTFFYTFVLMGCALGMYWMGWAVRIREKRRKFAAIGSAKREWLRIAALVLAVILGIAGCIAYRPDRESERGLQNLSSFSALESLISGEAQAYDEIMDKRDAALNDPAQPEVILEAVGEIPDAFMEDALLNGDAEEIIRIYKEYYEKQRVDIEGSN